MNVVDSSAWFEYLGDGESAAEFAGAIEAPENLVVPSLTIFEVFKRVCQIKDETTAFDALGAMLQGKVVDLTGSLALEAARLSLETGLAMADSIILATARSEGATLWTQDAHFAGLDDVEYRGRGGDMIEHVKAATLIKAEGDPPKAIEEFIGRVNTGTQTVSIARMKSPAGWSEPGQTPEFTEYTVVLRGSLRVTSRERVLDVGAGEAVVVEKGEWVQYSSPAEEGAEYISVCIPAFSPEAAHRDRPD